MYEIYVIDSEEKTYKLVCYDEIAAIDIAEQLSRIYHEYIRVEQGVQIIVEFHDGVRKMRE